MPLATKRVSASVPPPAGNGTTTFTGRVGIVLRGSKARAERERSCDHDRATMMVPQRHVRSREARGEPHDVCRRSVKTRMAGTSPAIRA